MAITQVNLANMVTGVLPVANGGTGSSNALVPSGTYMLFGQTSAPTGWTKITANNNAALRVVSGSASTGGTVDFTTAFASQGVSGTVGATTLTSTQIPSHSHTFSGNTGTVSADHTHTYSAQQPVGASGGGPVGLVGVNTGAITSGISQNHTHAYSGTTSNTGSGGSHDHTFTGTAINLAVKYVDVIMATKD